MLTKPFLLITDDNDTHRPLLESTLLDEYSLIFAPSATQAEEFLAAYSQSISVILFGISPETGFDERLMRRLLTISPIAKIVVFSDTQNAYLISELLKGGAFDFVNTPFIKDELLSTIQMASDSPLPEGPYHETQSHRETPSFSERLDLLRAFCERRIQRNQMVRMEAIYSFFPECKEMYYPKNMVVAPEMMCADLEAFIQRMLGESPHLKVYSLS